MIARIYIYVILMIVLSAAAVDWQFFHRRHLRWWKRLLFWFPQLLMVVYTLCLGLLKDFVPDNFTWVNVYLFLLGLLVVPQFVVVLCSLLGWCIQKLFRRRRNFGRLVGVMLVPLLWYVLIVGSTFGFSQFRVRHVTIESAELPAAFDGYRMVQFSDVHVGTYDDSNRWLLQRAVDSINAQHADVILFTGDLQNRQPSELDGSSSILSRLHAPDGVYSVFGNHDYPDYLWVPLETKLSKFMELIDREEKMGWKVLLNSHTTIRRGTDSLIIAGMENDGDGRHFAQRGNIAHTLDGVRRSAYVVMMQHDPSSWRRKILPHSHAQLTLSGHTHAMQFAIAGWSPVDFIYTEWGGLYELSGRHLFVSTGLGGFIPFRFGVPGEIVVITLKHKKSD